jgi:tetratricopeptide (TPR) repeat protein
MDVSRIQRIILAAILVTAQNCKPADERAQLAASYLDLSQNLLSRGSAAAAAQVAQRAAELASTGDARSAAFVTVSRAHGANGDLPAALEAATQAVAAAETGLALRQRGFIYGTMQQFDRAQQDFERAVELNPSDPESSAELANLIVSLRPNEAGLQRAHDLLSAAIVAVPENPTYYEYRGLVNDRLRRLEAAQADYTSAIERGATLSMTYFRRAILRLKAGDSGGCDDINEAVARGARLAALLEQMPMTRVCVGRLHPI